MRSIGLVEFGLFTALALIWGSAFLLIKVAVSGLAPVEIVFWRLSIATVVLGVFFWRWSRGRGWPLPTKLRPWGILVALGLIGNAIPFFLVSWAETVVPSSLAAILISLSPIITAVLIPAFVSNEVITRQRVVGIAVGFVGVVVLTGGLTLTQLMEDPLPKLALLIAALCYASTGILIRRAHYLPAPLVAFGMNMTALIFVVPIAFVIGDPFGGWPGGRSAASVLTLGLLPSALASIFLIHLIGRAGAAFTSTTNYVVPVVATVLGVVILGETIQLNALIGLAFILSGIWISSRQRPVAPEPASAPDGRPRPLRPHRPKH